MVDEESLTESLITRIADSLVTKGYYIHVFPLSEEDKRLRKSPRMKCWYLDLSSIELKTATKEDLDRWAENTPGGGNVGNE